MSFRSLLLVQLGHACLLVTLLLSVVVSSQKTCDNYQDIFVTPNKYNPFFSQPVFVTPPIRVDKHEYLNLLSFGVFDRDLVVDNVNENRVGVFSVTTNDSNFFVTQDLANNQFVFNFRGSLDYNINNAHRYVVELTVLDNGKPQRQGKALVFVPLINCNVHPPSFTPVTLVVATTFEVNCQLGILNAWDTDGDSVSFELSPSNTPAVFKYIDVLRNGTVVLKSSLAVLEHLEFSSFIVKITDDGSSCAQPPVVTLQSEMIVNLTIIDVNRHSPRFVADKSGVNYCEVHYKAKENSFFQIEIVAQDDDIRFPNGQILLRAPDLTDVSPQYSFNLTSRTQYGKQIVGVVSNLEQFDYENPKYGSNTLNLMFYAEDKGLPKRIGYCFMTIEIQDVNDNAPMFSQRNYNIYIHEQYKTRYFTYRFIAQDKDSDSVIKYFMDQSSSSLSRELFVLSLDGTLTVRNATCLDQMKKEDRLEFSIYATDGKFESERVVVAIIKTSLKILPPFFSDFPEPAELANVSEMTPRGTSLRSFKIFIQTDPTDQFLRCFLSPKPNPEWFKFSSNQSDSQQLTKQETCSLVIEDPLNYRVASSMVVYMIAEVGSKKVRSTARELKMLTIFLKEENINSPKFVSNTIEASVVEGDEDLNKIIAVVRAYDIDKTSPNNKISYSFDQTGYVLNYSYFSIDPITGEIKLTSKIKNEKNIPLTVYARDGTNGFNSNKPNMNNIYVDVKVIDINDNSPVFNQYSYVFNVSETSRPGAVIGRLEVIDLDTLSDFYYSISDSTFGIRSIFDQQKIKAYSNYRGSAEIYLNNYLDFDKKREYTLTVFVSDSQFFSSASVTINVINEYDKPPRFDKPVYDVYIKEEQTPEGVIVTLNAIGDPMLSNNFVFEAYSAPNLNADWFDLNRHNGELRLIRGLDRDLPTGSPVYDLSVSVSYAENPSLKSYAIVRIVLDDINDNAPYLVYGKNRPLIIEEERDAASVEIFVVDVDSTATTPFQFILLGFNDLFFLQKLDCFNCVHMERYSLQNKISLRRLDRKFYIIPYQVSDVGGMSRNGTLQLLVGDVNNNAQQNGSKQIRIVRYQHNLGYNLFLGTLYVRDLDDWDLVGKQTSNCYQSTGSTFEIRQGLQIYGPTSFESFPRDNMNLQCVVNDPFQTEQPSTVLARVDFSLEDVEYADTIDLVGVRLMGIQAEDLVKKINIGDTSPLEMLLSRIVSILQLNGQSDVIRVVTIRNFVNNGSKVIANQILNFDNSSFGADVYFFARQSGRLISSQYIYQLLYSGMNQLTSSHYSNIVLLFDMCLSKSNDYCPINSFCKQNFITSSRSLTVDANATAFVGMNTALSTECYCTQEVTQSATCFNGGTVKSFNLNGYPQYYCVCPPGYDGPRCQFLSITFTYMPSSPSHSYALFQPIKLCDPTRIEFDFTTERTKGLLLFNGPINRESIYFLAVEIANSSLLVHVGSTLVSFPAVNVSDKAWHHVDILLSLNHVQVILDKCSSSLATIANYTEMKSDVNGGMDEVRLSLGGIPPKISLNHFYYKMLNVFEYEGCVRNLKVNGELRNLKLVPNDYNLAQNAQQCDCMYLAKCDSNAAPVIRTNEFPWWIILIILGALLILASILGLAVCAVRRKDGQKKMLQMFPDDDIRETIINYADGAGEENTDNFNIGVIKKPLGPLMQTTTTTTMTPGGMIIQEGHISNIDLPSNDQNMIYACEGEGSEVGSLSSLQSSNYADKDLDYDFLRECGPKFVKLSNIYVKNDINAGGGEHQVHHHIHHHHQQQHPDFHHQNFAYDYTDDQMRVMMSNQQRIG